MNEIEYLHDRSMCIIEFMLAKAGGNLTLEQVKLIIGKAYSERNLKALKSISRDMNAWSKGLPLIELRELEKILINKFGDNLSGDKITLSLIDQILTTGIIENKEMYRVVYEYLQDISDTDLYFERANELELLLANYNG